jgi:hypothetical protein
VRVSLTVPDYPVLCAEKHCFAVFVTFKEYLYRLSL